MLVDFLVLTPCNAYNAVTERVSNYKIIAPYFFNEVMTITGKVQLKLQLQGQIYYWIFLAGSHKIAICQGSPEHLICQKFNAAYCFICLTGCFNRICKSATFSMSL